MNNFFLNHVNFIFKCIRLVYYRVKKPFSLTLYHIKHELFNKPPFIYRYFGYNLVYKKGDGLITYLASGYPYEKQLLSWIVNNIKRDSIVIDIGANIGLISLVIARVAPKSIIHCFEPSPIPYFYFKKTIRLNKLYHRIILNKLGLYSRQSNLGFHVHNYKDSSGDGIRDTLRAGATKKIKIRVTTLDKYVSENKIKHIDLIKIDVEGAEMHVLRGGLNTIKKYSPKIIFEAWPENLKAYSISVLDLFLFFKKINYKIYHPDGKLLDEESFLFLTKKEANYIALPK